MNQYGQMKIEIQAKIQKVITDRKAWSQMLGDDVSNTNGIIKPYEMITEMDYYAWPGGYSLFYFTKDGGVLCPKCVNKNLELLSDEDDPQWYVIGCEMNEENDDMYCENCGEQIESAYGEDDSDE